MTDVPEWLGLVQYSEHHWSFELTSPLGRGDGKLYGGTGLAAVVALQEIVTGRDALWTTVQFAGSANPGDRLDCEVEVLAEGRRNSQLRVTVRVNDMIVLAALGAAGVHTDSPLQVQVPTMPVVPDPDHSNEWFGRMQNPNPGRRGWAELCEMRQVDVPDNAFMMWGRMRNQPVSRPALAFMADFVPVSVARAGGAPGAGISLDNSMRFGRLVETDWVLYDFDPLLATGGYLHGGVRVWAQDGTLLGYASQTAAGFIPVANA